MSSRKKNNEQFDNFGENEALTQRMYDNLYGEDQGEESGQKTMRYEDAGIDERILRAVRTMHYDNASADTDVILKAGDLTMNLTDYTVTKRGQKVELTAKEFEILKLLLQNPKKVYTKEQIYSLVWNDAYLGDENAVNVHISRLRNKIEEDSRKPVYILTVWGIGYKLGSV